MDDFDPVEQYAELCADIGHEAAVRAISAASHTRGLAEGEKKGIEKLEGRDFYELCQQYRHCQVDAAKEFEAIKEYIRSGKLPWPSYEETIEKEANK